VSSEHAEIAVYEPLRTVAPKNYDYYINLVSKGQFGQEF